MAKQTHPLAGGIGILAALALLFSASAGAELRSLGDSDLDDVVGQAGISISASLNLQEILRRRAAPAAAARAWRSSRPAAATTTW